MGEKFYNLIKNIYKEPTTSIILNSETADSLPLRSETRQGCPLLQLLFNTVLGVLANLVRKEKEIKSILMGREKIKTVYADDMIPYIDLPEESTKELLELVSDSVEHGGHKIIYQSYKSAREVGFDI